MTQELKLLAEEAFYSVSWVFKDFSILWKYNLFGKEVALKPYIFHCFFLRTYFAIAGILVFPSDFTRAFIPSIFCTFYITETNVEAAIEFNVTLLTHFAYLT